jgi:hypothetical protein
MPNQPHRKPDPNQIMDYEIRVKGHLGPEWADWFGGLTVHLDESGETLISCPGLDQAALHGVLKKVRDLGLMLVSVNPITKIEKE